MAEKQATNSELLTMFRRPKQPEPSPETAVKAPEPPKAEVGGVGQGDAAPVAPEPKAAPEKATKKVTVERAQRKPERLVGEQPSTEMVDRKLRLPKRTLDRLRAAAAYSTPHTSLGRLAAEAIDAHIDQLEKRRGSKFPVLEGELPPGRRVGT